MDAPAEEVWREVPGYEGHYEVSSLGRVRSMARAVPVKASKYGGGPRQLAAVELQQVLSRGYPAVTLYRGSRGKSIRVHMLVALAFLGPRPSGLYVCHRDDNRLNPALGNLRYDTPKANSADKAGHGRQPRGETIPWARLTEAAVREIREARGKESQRSLAARFGVGQPAISRIQAGKHWAHVEGVS